MQVVGHKSTRRSGEQWLVFLKKTSVSLGCLLLASAAICWVAANWEHASGFQKIAGAQLSLLALVVLAWWRMRRNDIPREQDSWTAGLLIALAAVMVGANLALIGQIYHTGADPWQLFLGWLVLLLPWLWAMPGPALALLSSVLANVSMVLYLDEGGGPFWLGAAAMWPTTAILLALANSLMLIAAEFSDKHRRDRWRIVPRTLASSTLAWLVVSALAAIGNDNGALGASLPGFVAVALVAAFYSRPAHSDLVIVSLAMLAGFLLLAIPMIAAVGGQVSLLLVTAALLVVAGLGLRHLRRLVRAATREQTEDGGVVPGRAADAWYVSVFRIIAMGITAALLIALLFMTFEPETWALWPWGLFLSGLGLGLYRWTGRPVLREFAMTLVTAGLILACVGVHANEELSIGLRMGLLLAWGLLLYWFVDNAALRLLIAVLVLAMMLMLAWPDHVGAGPGAMPSSEAVWRHLPAYSRLWWLSLAAVLAWAVRPGRNGEPWRPLAWALVLVVQALAWFAPAPAIFGLGTVWQQSTALVVIWVACAALPVVALGALLWRVPGLSMGIRAGAPGVLALASLGWMGVPGVGAAVLWLILGFALSQPRLVGFAVMALLSYLAWFYYQLDATLLHKSLLLAGTGAWLFLGGMSLRRRRLTTQTSDAGLQPQQGLETDAKPYRPRPWSSPHAQWRQVALFLGLTMALATLNARVYHHEHTLANGRVVVLALAPVDPRSLIQGDYMALRYEIGNQIADQLVKAPNPISGETARRGEGYVLLRADGTGVHRFVGVAAGREEALAASPAAIMLFKWRDRNVRIGTDAWFFPEGQAGRYEQARYGEFRVTPDGEALLHQLLDGALRPLP